MNISEMIVEGPKIKSYALPVHHDFEATLKYIWTPIKNKEPAY